MNKKPIIIILSILVLVLLGWYLFKKEIGSVSIPSKSDKIEDVNNTAQPTVSYLTVPRICNISIC
jgi:hypothetical protein